MKLKHSRRSFLTQSSMAGIGSLSAFPIASFGQGFQDAIENTSQSSRPSDLRITSVSSAFLRGGSRLFVKIETNQGIVGYGEGVDAVSGTHQMVQNLGFRLVRRNPLDVHRLFEDIRRGGIFGGAQSGVFVAVLSAIETALWDVAGKALDLPLYQLLGGKFRDSVRVYMDTALYQSRNPSPEQFGEAALEALDMGMTGVKFDLDQAGDPSKFDQYNWTASQGELERMEAQVAAARAAVGSSMDICFDMHGRYDLPTGKKVAEMLEPYNLMWLEEPVPAENIDALKQINDASSTPICAGENIYLSYGFRRALEIGAVDMIMPDLQKVGGLGEGQRIANLANVYYVPFAPHMVASYLGAMASAHVCASVPNFMILEWQIYFHREQQWTDIVDHEGPMVVDGFIPLSEKPGIGVNINEEGLRRYADTRAPFFGEEA